MFRSSFARYPRAGILAKSPLDYYSKNGLKVEVIKAAGQAVIRDKSLAKEPAVKLAKFLELPASVAEALQEFPHKH